MKTPTTIPANPYIFLDDEIVSINCGSEHHQICVSDINKIHITKRKYGYWSGMIGHMLFIPETHYNLNIETSKGSFKIKINPFERFFCIKLVSIIRSSKPVFA